MFVLLGPYRGDTFPLYQIKVVGDKHLQAGFNTSKVRGTLDLTVNDYGQANPNYTTTNLAKNVTRSLWSSDVQSKIFKPAKAAGNLPNCTSHNQDTL